jgi:hypothetical protein
MVAALGIESTRPVVAVAVAPRVTMGRDVASFETHVCADHHHGRIGVVAESHGRELCPQYSPVQGLRLGPGFDDHYIVLVVTAHRPGRVVVDGAWVTYIAGRHFHAEHTGMGLDLVFS